MQKIVYLEQESVISQENMFTELRAEVYCIVRTAFVCNLNEDAMQGKLYLRCQVVHPNFPFLCNRKEEELGRFRIQKTIQDKLVEQ